MIPQKTLTYAMWDRNFPESRLVRKIHMFVIGEESNQEHLAGIANLGADEIVIFEPGRKKKSGVISRLQEMGVAFRTVAVSDLYFDTFKKASVEAAASFVNESVIAINLGCGPRIAVSALEDAVRTQLFYFHRRSRAGTFASAFRYTVNKDTTKVSISVAPIWDLFSNDHNDIFEALGEIGRSVTVKELWEFLCDKRQDVWRFEAFRKVFRDFRRWFTNQPCFEEKTGKGPLYRLRV
jgi:hypothetical protein